VWYNQGLGDAMTDPAEIAARNKQYIRETIAGYAAAAEIGKQMRIEQLQRMTPQETWAEFEELVELGLWLKGDPESLKVFEPRRIEEHVYMRRVFEKLARARGLI
jgi:hypothetical protein